MAWAVDYLFVCFVFKSHRRMSDSQDQIPQGLDFSPSDTSSLTEESHYSYEVFYHKLRQYRDQLSPAIQQRITKEVCKELAMSLLDGTVFEIVKELEDIQQLSERALLNKRMKLVSGHKTQKVSLSKKHKEEVAACNHKPHNLPLIKGNHEKEKAELDTKLREELRLTDQKVILELDQLVTDQQSTMQQAAVPLFTVTNDATEIQVQMHVLNFIQKLAQLPMANGTGHT